MCYLAASSLYWPWVCVSTAPWGSSRRRRFSVSCKSSVVTLDRPSAWARTDGDILARIRFRWTFRKHPRSLNLSSQKSIFLDWSGMDSRPGGGLYFRLSNLTKAIPSRALSARWSKDSAFSCESLIPRRMYWTVRGPSPAYMAATFRGLLCWLSADDKLGADWIGSQHYKAAGSPSRASNRKHNGARLYPRHLPVALIHMVMAPRNS
jgi:hypothetical protein